MKVKSSYKKDTCGNIVVSFDNYVVIQKSKNFFGVYDEYNTLKTHGTTLSKATKKAKLLEIGYQDAKDIYSGRY